jgi:hypothetical protein
MNKKQLFKNIIPLISMVGLSAIVLGSCTYAYKSGNNNVAPIDYEDLGTIFAGHEGTSADPSDSILHWNAQGDED